jgi:membrane protease YdiL (CAAX protease family)
MRPPSWPPWSLRSGRRHNSRSRLGDRLPRSLGRVAPPRVEPPSVVRRRRLVVAATSVAGAAALGTSLSTPPGSPRFYLYTLGTAAVWATGGLASGPLHLGRLEDLTGHRRRPVLAPVVTGVVAFGFFYGCALVVRRVPVLDRAICGVLDFAEQGSGPLVLLSAYTNALGEEVFFRGAVYTALAPTRPVLGSAGVYTAATTFTRNPSLVLASAVMGPLFSLQRRASGGILAPLLTHLTWSTLMVRFLPPLFRDRPSPPPSR